MSILRKALIGAFASLLVAAGLAALQAPSAEAASNCRVKYFPDDRITITNCLTSVKMSMKKNIDSSLVLDNGTGQKVPATCVVTESSSYSRSVTKGFSAEAELTIWSVLKVKVAGKYEVSTTKQQVFTKGATFGPYEVPAHRKGWCQWGTAVVSFSGVLKTTTCSPVGGCSTTSRKVKGKTPTYRYMSIKITK